VGWKMASKIIQVAPEGSQKASDALTFSRSWNLTRFQKVARSAQGIILHDLLCILGPTWPQFYRFWKQFWHRLLHNMLANRRKARNTMQRTCITLAIAMGTKRWPQNPKRMQSPRTRCKIPAENWQRTCGKLIITNAHLEPLCDILQFSKQRQLQQPANYKIRWRRCARRMAHQDTLRARRRRGVFRTKVTFPVVFFFH
jgi:hypothetical protein